MAAAGRRVLVRCVLSAMLTFGLTVLCAPKKLFKDIDKCRRRFLWTQDDEISGGSCKVNWTAVCAPTTHGLGLHNLSASAVPYTWDGATLSDHGWANLQQGRQGAVRRPNYGDGWRCRGGLLLALFLAGAGTLATDFPTLYKHWRRKNRTVKAALAENTWIWDLAHGNVQNLVHDFIVICQKIQEAGIVTNEEVQDTIR